MTNEYKQRLQRIEEAQPGDILLYDSAGAVIFLWRAKGSSASGLGCFMYLTEEVAAGDAEIIKLLRRAHRASEDFGRLHQLVASLIDESDGKVGRVQ